MIKFLDVKRAYYADPENVRVQLLTERGVWVDVGKEPDWLSDIEYRIRPRTIRIGDIDVPEPVRIPPNAGDTYYSAEPTDEDFYLSFTWDDDSVDFIMLVRGLIHLTKEAAIEHAKALIIVSGGKV